MRIFIMFFIFIYSFGYVSATKGILGEDTFIYTNNGFISKGKVKISYLNNLSKDFPIENKEVIIDNEIYSVDSISKKDIFNYLEFANVKNKVLINNNLCDITHSFVDENNIIEGFIRANDYKVICNGKNIFEVELFDNVPIKFKIDNKTYVLKRIINNNVRKYERLKKELRTELRGFDFFRENIFATYEIKSKNNISYLKVIYKLEDKKNNIFSVTLKAPLNILDFFQSYSSPAKNVSYLFVNNSTLYEWQKILYLNNEPILRWVFEDGEVGLVYLNDKGEEVEKHILSSKLPYDIGGVWYLVSFMDKNNINYEDISYITNTRFEGKINRITSKSYEFKIFSGEVLIDDMIFYLDKYSRIEKIYDKKRDITIQLKGDFLSDEIIKNREFLKHFLTSHNLKEINEN